MIGRLVSAIRLLIKNHRAISLSLVVVGLALWLGLGVILGRLSVKQSQPDYGQVVNINGQTPVYLTKDVDFGLFWKVWDYLHRTYLERPLGDTKLFYGALEGMVAGLGDPYSIFMNPDTAKQFNQELEGSFEGIGAEIGIRANQLVIIAPLPSTPSERAGLRAGDKILAIDNFDTNGMAVDYAVSLIRGPRGTKVKLTVWQNGDKENKEIILTRERIEIEIVHAELKPLPLGQAKVAYIKIAHFSSNTDELFREAWQTMAAKGAQGIVLDLRNNPGGYLDQAIEISSHWIADGVVVKEQFAPPEFREHRSTGKGELGNIPTMVLVNQGSASASEIVAGALQDEHRATLIGEQTFGKGSVQDLEQFPDGSAVKVTIAKWFTPKGRSIDKNGIKPDIEIKLTREDVEAGNDPQLARALELLAR
jgi:carboxyl-terminal processing protease